MLRVGLTGGIASGKSTVGRLFTELGVPLIDADQVARDVVQPGEPALDAIAEHFGQASLTPEGTLNRPWLRQVIFADPAEKTWLEQLLHPLIFERIRTWLATQTAPYCILESPLLLEGNQKSLVDRVLVVDVPEPLQLERAMARDGSPPETLKAIMAAQSPRSFRLQHADDIILNDRSLEDLKHDVQTLHNHYLRLADTDGEMPHMSQARPLDS